MMEKAEDKVRKERERFEKRIKGKAIKRKIKRGQLTL